MVNMLGRLLCVSSSPKSAHAVKEAKPIQLNPVNILLACNDLLSKQTSSASRVRRDELEVTF